MSDRVRVLYSFPHKLGAGRICYTAWQQVNGLVEAGAELLVCPGAICRGVSPEVQVAPTLAKWGGRLPYRVFGTIRTLALHDAIVARRLKTLRTQIDIVHTWPLGALRTLKAARALGIPAVLERPNAHTRFAYEVVRDECRRMGITLPRTHEHAFNSTILEIEEEEYELADAVLCPSEFVVKTFVDKGFEGDRLMRHTYGFDETLYRPDPQRTHPSGRGLRVLFVGVCAVRKGLHFALQAWLRSPAHNDGIFQIAGEFLPAYAEKLQPMLRHPSVKVLGHATNVPELMRDSDILVLPSIEEGYGLVIAEAIGSGCVPLASDACTEICGHVAPGFVHRVGDVETLAAHLTMLHNDRGLLSRLRSRCLECAPAFTWRAAGRTLLSVYQELIARKTTPLTDEVQMPRVCTIS